MPCKSSITVDKKIVFIIFIAVLFSQTPGCKVEEGDSKVMNTETVDVDKKIPAIIRIVNLSNNVTFANAPTVKGADLQDTGILKAIGESSWVDVEYMDGEKFRLKNGSVELSFGEQLTSNIGGLDFGGDSIGSNTRIIKLKSGKLFVHIAKFELLRKVKYYFSTDIVDLNLLHGSFTLEANDNLTHLSLCEGSISIIPRNATQSDQRPTWSEIKLQDGNTVSVNLTKAPRQNSLLQSEKELIATEFSAMGVSTCSSP